MAYEDLKALVGSVTGGDKYGVIFQVGALCNQMEGRLKKKKKDNTFHKSQGGREGLKNTQ